MKTSSLFLAAIFGVLLAGCVATSVTVSVRQDNANLQQLEQTHVDDPWIAIQHYGLAHCQTDSTDLCLSTILNTISLINQQKVSDAINLLQTVHSAGDTTCRKHLKQLLSIILIEQGKWRTILEINDSTLIEPEALKMATAFQHSPPEQLSFYEQDDTIIVHQGYFGLPFIDVTINGVQQRFLLDTGTSETILSSNIAEQCLAFPVDTSVIQGKSTTQDNLAAHPTIIDSIRIGRLTIKNHTAIILDKDALSFKLLGIFPVFKIDGIIGWRLLRQIDLTLDYDRHTLTVREPKNTKRIGSILLSLGKPYVLATTDTGIPLMFFWDSGAQSSSLTPTGIKKLHNAREDITISSRWSAGGSTLQVVPTIKDVTVLLSDCTLHFRNMKTIPNRDSLLTYDGIFGNDIAKKGIIRANAINGTLQYFLRLE